VSDWRAQAVVGNIEVGQRAAHEDAGRVDLLIECVLAIDKKHVDALLGEQAGTLKTGESGADDGHVVAVHSVVKVLCLAKLRGKKRDGSALNCFAFV